MSQTTKETSTLQGQQVLKKIFNSEDSSITSASFLVGKVGRRIEQAISTTTVANDTETFTYIEDGKTLYAIQIVYTSGTREDMLYSERVQ